ncbi:hypothetical protein EVAR_99457_1, partial [Eumeta japonica]
VSREAGSCPFPVCSPRFRYGGWILSANGFHGVSPGALLWSTWPQHEMGRIDQWDTTLSQNTDVQKQLPLLPLVQ